MSFITSYHAHVYYTEESVSSAESVYEASKSLHNVEQGRFHRREVGPHTRWSFQLAFNTEELNKVIPWLTLNREGLTVMIHPNTDNEYKDHSEHVMWLGKPVELKLSIF